MALTVRHTELQVLTKLRKGQISQLKNGVRIAALCADTIENLVLAAASDRYQLGKRFFSEANRLLRSRPAMERSSISRSYYGMYHVARALAFLATGGDDNEAHSDLHKGLPEDFPDVDKWRNALKEARLLRNEVDYDPYVEGQYDLGMVGRTQLANVGSFLREAEFYLRARGCAI